MILLIGGAFQGKTALALEKLNGSPTWILGEETAWQGEGQIVSHLERFIRPGDGGGPGPERGGEGPLRAVRSPGCHRR